MTRFLASFLYLLSIQGSPTDEGTCFPGEKQSLSPTRPLISYKWEAEMHQLYFQKSRRHKPTKLLTFDRSACVRWSPSGDFFALTNHAGSNISVVEIVSSDDLTKRVRISDVLPPAARALTSGALHAYVEVRSWTPDGLIIRIHGERAGEPREFDVLVPCRFEAGQWSCSRP